MNAAASITNTVGEDASIVIAGGSDFTGFFSASELLVADEVRVSVVVDFASFVASSVGELCESVGCCVPHDATRTASVIASDTLHRLGFAS
ncbi:MAG TPA: hypothetical protein VMB26_00770, partial [Candidatus Binataceae bacterium]|nr:hypothetical protein [Candidatus Binataceae bacterium]